jgi:hypothetical protein
LTEIAIDEFMVIAQVPEGDLDLSDDHRVSVIGD